MLFFKLTQQADVHNRNILDDFNINLGEALESQQVIPLDYGSEFRDTNGIANLLHNN